MDIGRPVRTVEIVEEPEPAYEPVEAPTVPEPEPERVPA
jgi:hypothetical protein